MSEFTPGPWSIVPYGDGDSLVIHSDDENRVCFMATHGGTRSQWERIQANAALIAAAPDLFEIVRQVAEGALPDIALGYGPDDTIIAWRAIARDALAKVRTTPASGE